MSYHLSIIGTKDNPVYQLTIGTFKQDNQGQHSFTQRDTELIPFIINSSIDLIEDLQWISNNNYLKNYDSNKRFKLNCYLTISNIKLILLYDLKDNNMKNDESLKQFLVEINELYLKHNLNPFYNVNDLITSDVFDLKVKLLLRKYL